MNQDDQIENDPNNHDQGQVVEEEEESDTGSVWSDEGVGDMAEERSLELEAAREEYTEKVNRYHSFLVPAPVAVAVGGAGGNAPQQQNNQLPAARPHQQPGRYARVFAWAKTRPQWGQVLEELRESLGQVSQQELELRTFMKVMDLQGLQLPPGVEDEGLPEN